MKNNQTKKISGKWWRRRGPEKPEESERRKKMTIQERVSDVGNLGSCGIDGS